MNKPIKEEIDIKMGYVPKIEVFKKRSKSHLKRENYMKEVARKRKEGLTR